MGTSPTNTASVDYTVTFSEAVTGVGTDDFAVTHISPNGTLTGLSVASVSGSGTTYTVTVNTGSGNGALRLDVPATATVEDLSANDLAGLPFQTGQTYFMARLQTFDDVATTYWAWSFIERLYAAGITGGCAPGTYCLGSVNRAQMAIFLERGMNGPTFTPPAATGTIFTDVSNTYWAASWIEQLYNDGITAGCGAGIYCPENNVTRAEMAIFLLRAKHGSSYTPPAATGVFDDVPTTYWAAAWIEQLYAEGITGGCSAGNYCPEQSITRDQMAIFLVRAFNLP